MTVSAAFSGADGVWKSLRTLCGVRVVIAGAAVFVQYTASHSSASATVAWTYLALALGGLALAFLPRPRFAEQLTAVLAIDMLCIGTLVLTEVNSTNATALLFFAPVAGAALLARLPIALFVAATASLLLLADALLRQLGGAGDQGYAQVGTLGAVMFAVAYVLNRLAARVIAQERLVQAKNAELRTQVLVNRAVIDEMRLGILIVSHDGRVRAANPAARSVLDIDDGGSAEGLGEQLVRRYPTLARVLASWTRTPPAQSRAWTVVLEAAPPAGDAHPPADQASRPGKRVRIRSIPFGVEKLTDASLLVSIEDMREVEVQATQLKLAAMGRLTASIAHEIRNPLAAIGHASALLAEETQAPETQRLLRIVQDNVGRLDRIVEDVLSVSRSTRVRSERLRLAQTVGQIVADFARDRGVDPARFALDIDTTFEIGFDRAHLTQIVVNLIANAARYASAAAGAIEVTADRRADGAIELTIANDGPPIGADGRAQLFEPFFTTDRHGTGLGLFLGRELALANGADLFLDDAAIAAHHCGAAFTLRIGAAAESNELSEPEVP